ncbi:two-component sensor histidine kinase [Streptomyces benahoarensis]|uniref:histidine kinase n=2 Tax=Streptomyces benahoarensis TaxID=2595054 RepID=A0A553YXG2_9ACTN|nr:two-component sensor histidine kinase [Streptomyces benahoarensis]TSB33900.1 two-component sensor histidine kinase [Streptomyces benahoarensis]
MLPLDDPGVPGWRQRLPRRIRRYVRWAPHIVVALAAVANFLLGVTATLDLGSSYHYGILHTPLSLVFSLLVAAPVALTLFRPVGAFWVSFAGFVLAMLDAANGSYDATWPMVSLPTHVVVMALVVLRTRPRLALEMWVVTIVAGGMLSTASGFGYRELLALAVPSAFILTAAAAVRAWREERRHVVETQTATAEERSRRTLLEERATIARELHDVVAHHMSVIAIQAEAAPYRVEHTPPELATSFATIRENAVAALAELRRILGVVRSEDPDAFAEHDPEAPQPSLARLDGLLNSVRGAGLTVEAVVTGAARPLPQGVELSAYRIVQEALSNTLRHAPGAEARVEISYVLGGIGLRIVNGKPSRLATPSPGAGHGVLGMRERVQMLGGEMTADHTEDGGFEVAAFLPVSAAGEAKP